MQMCTKCFRSYEPATTSGLCSSCNAGLISCKGGPKTDGSFEQIKKRHRLATSLPGDFGYCIAWIEKATPLLLAACRGYGAMSSRATAQIKSLLKELEE